MSGLALIMKGKGFKVQEVIFQITKILKRLRKEK